MTRYTLGTAHKDGIGQPAMIEAADGEYVKHSDYAACVAHNEMLAALLMRAEGREG